MEWTDEQREGLRPAWDAYCRRTAAIRERASVQLNATTASAALQSIYAWEATGSKALGPLMGAYAELTDTVGGCEAWMRLEVLAFTELVCGCMEVSCESEGHRRSGRELTPASNLPPPSTDDEPGKSSEAERDSQALHPRRHSSLPVAALQAGSRWEQFALHRDTFRRGEHVEFVMYEL